MTLNLAGYCGQPQHPMAEYRLGVRVWRLMSNLRAKSVAETTHTDDVVPLATYAFAAIWVYVKAG